METWITGVVVNESSFFRRTQHRATVQSGVCTSASSGREGRWVAQCGGLPELARSRMVGNRKTRKGRAHVAADGGAFASIPEPKLASLI